MVLRVTFSGLGSRGAQPLFYVHLPTLDKPTSEQVRREAEKLRAGAVKLMEQAAILIEKSAALEKRILGATARSQGGSPESVYFADEED
jgi:hypothetical protein